ncbi:MAG TPA: hypothetical protein VFB66_26505 [Tepidisphaeraceae bacterium]|nr:hypothetical protein [Tepidisphaeraceae bacterium]
MRPRIPILAALLLLLVASPAALAQQKRAEVERTVVNVSGLKPGEKALAAVVVDIKPGFHAQSRTPLEDFYVKFE